MLSTSDMKTRKSVKFAVSALTMSILLSTLAVSPVHADDLEIYQPSQTGGRKTLILMLDSSGSMSSNFRGANKMQSVVDGMIAFLDNTTKADLNDVWVGLGHYSAFNDPDDASGNHASILVPAERLGPAGSAHRNRIRAALLSTRPNPEYFKGNGNTPSLNGYVEAAAYLMGTLTANATNPVVSGAKTNFTLRETINGTTTDESGFNSSVDVSKNLTDTSRPKYLSPLPAPADRMACDGQGIYFLAGGPLNSTANRVAVNLMSKALGSTDLTENTYCPTDYAGLDGMIPLTNAPWNCMAKFSRTLYDRTANPAGVSIKTAYVGFGNDFVGLTSDTAINACHVSSRLKEDKCATDAPLALRNPPGGYGNGGFYVATDATTVTTSVINFIDNLGKDEVAPLVTGAASIPVDDLNPNGFHPYGYLRMLAPNPAKSTQLLWNGNLKKYALSGGAMVSKDSTTLKILNSLGQLNLNTTDLWNPLTTGADGHLDGGIIDKGGAHPRVPLPTTTLDVLRPVFTDVGSVQSDGSLSGVVNGASLTAVTASVPRTTTIPAFFGTTHGDGATDGVAPLNELSLVQKLKLINYLGYNLPLDLASITTPLPTSEQRWLSMGGSIHAQPIQLSYSSKLNPNGSLKEPSLSDPNPREESVLYGSMEGGLHLVNATTGVEQMVFVPKEILADDVQSRALRRGEVDGTAANTPSQGVDGPWVTDPAYKTVKTTSKLEASRMNVYGGLRMGGSSYYGLDLLTKSGNAVTPNLLFRIGPDVAGYDQMGQSWSKPVLANVRYGSAIIRVMIVGGGYDTGYESPSFAPTASTPARGNTVYMVNAKTGALIWKATTTANANLFHSIAARVSPIDRDADSLIDSIYFADLGGQVFRADFNNKFGTSTSNFGVRVTRLANLVDSTAVAGSNPRFYEAPTITVHDHLTNTFGLVTVASGNRSSPLDVLSLPEGGKALRNLPVNKVYGIIDRDVARADFLTMTPAETITKNKTLGDLQPNPQTLSDVIGAFFPTTGDGKDGWYRSLSSTNDCLLTATATVCATAYSVRELADGTFRYTGGLKAFEEQVALTGKLYVPVYDPQGKGVEGDPCQPRVVGETDLQTYCLPYGVCLDSSGAKNNYAESQSGAKLPGTTTDPNKDALIGPGIRGISLGDNSPTGAGTGDCKSFTIVGNTSGTGNWNCTKKLVQTLWYEKQPNRSKVQ